MGYITKFSGGFTVSGYMYPAKELKLQTGSPMEINDVLYKLIESNAIELCLLHPLDTMR